MINCTGCLNPAPVPFNIFADGTPISTFSPKMNFELPLQNDAFQAWNSWEFTISHEGREVQISMDEIEGLSDDTEFIFFKQIVASIFQQIDASKNYASAHFLEQFNSKWNPGVSISRHEFESRLVPSLIFIKRDKHAVLEFSDDSDMFLSHAIHIDFDGSGKIIGLVLNG